MARISKYGVEIADRIVEYISLGYTLRDTAYAVDVSDETIRRWRDRYPDFNKRVVEASNRQWERPETLVKYHYPSYRGYKRRKIALSPDYGPKVVKDTSNDEKPLLEPLRPAKPQYVCGLPVRPETASLDQKIPPYYNTSNGSVEWVSPYPTTGRLILHRCTLDAYKQRLERERQRRTEPFIFCVA